MALSMEKQIALIQTLNYPELVAKVEELYGFTPGNTSIITLRHRLIYRIQEMFFEGLSLPDRKYLESVAEKDPLVTAAAQKREKGTKVGSVYERIWKGQKHEVTYLGNKKYEYNNNIYTSLSVIAREITGTRWNGKVFFGVK